MLLLRMENGNYKLEDFILDDSFQRYVLHKNQSDKKYWENWIDKHPETLSIIESAREIITYISERKINHKNQKIRNEVYEKLLNQIGKEKPSAQKTIRKINMKYYWYAATLLLLVSFTIALYNNNKKKETPFLTNQFLEVIVPEGQRSQLLLPDGTKVWLNSGSKFKYPINFMLKSRDVYIDGEAYFDVKHNKNQPFVVHLNEKFCIKVLGTEFNVKSYTNEKSIETTLIRGSIKLIQGNTENSKITEVDLKPSEKAIFVKTNQTLSITKLFPAQNQKIAKNIAVKQYMENLEPITAWKEDQLVFSNETFEEIAIKMERWFGFRIKITDEELKKERFTGKFANQETIYQVLEIFNRSEPIRFNVKNKEITINKN